MAAVGLLETWTRRTRSAAPAPEHPFPIGIEDVWAGVLWVQNNLDFLGGKPDNLIMGGLSAGGNITAALVQRAKATGLVSIRGHILREPLVVHPAAQPAGVDFSSYLDSEDAPILPTLGVHRCLEWYKPVPDDLRMSPLLAEDFSGLPPAYVQIAGVDPLRCDAFAYIDKLQAAGVPVRVSVYPRLPHAFQMVPLKSSQQSDKELIYAVKWLIGSERDDDTGTSRPDRLSGREPWADHQDMVNKWCGCAIAVGCGCSGIVVAKYFNGIGTKTSSYDKYNDAITGDGCKELIRDVYQYCCAEVTSPDDELWLYGFSRGAYVVRAVSALFRDLATLHKQTTGQFNQDYRAALGFLNAKQKRQMSNKQGELYNFFLEKTREGPAIQFLGLFDTVKKAQGDVDFDLSYSRSIRRVRHALALNEERNTHQPELYKTESTPGWDAESLIQAWFVGWHVDIGGGARDDGLSLYPLQWMLLESQKFGLVLEYKPPKYIADKIPVEHPPSLVLPSIVSESGSDQPFPKTCLFSGGPVPNETNKETDQEVRQWDFCLASGITVNMFDLRASHRHGNLQKRQGKKLKKKGHVEKASHEVRLNPPDKLFTGYQRRPRSVFDARGVAGYNEHVYFLKDTYPSLGIKDALQKMEDRLEDFSSQFQSPEHSNFFPWLLERTLKTRYEQVRILICGRSGVGKSTLLNRIFGMKMTVENEDTRGIHDMEQGFESDQYPGIIIHDSEGFEAGDIKRVQAFEMFLKKRGSSAPEKDQLHAVWICNDMDTSRPIEAAFELVLGIIAKYAPSLPVVLVGTKKDKFLRQETELSKEEIRALETGRAPEPQRELDIARDLQKRQSWQKRLAIDCADANDKLDIKVTFVSRDNRESIMALMHLTLEPLNSESLRSGMVAAQVVDLDLKIALAVEETVRLLRTAVTASNLGALLVVVNRISAPTYSRLLCNAIVRSFGLTRTTTSGLTREEEVDNIMSTVVWRNLSSFMARSFFVAIGDVSLLVAAPLFEAPVTARMVVKCACDLIIIMDRAFHTGGKFVTRQQIRQASREYVQPLAESELRGLRDRTGVKSGSSRRRLVHKRVNALIPVISALAVKIYRKRQIESLQRGIREIIEDYRIQSATDHYLESDESVASSDTLSVGTGSLDETLDVASEDDEDLKAFSDMSIKGQGA
ncbi:hypothetical protein ACHAP9_001587 [Verticillium nonalfalfae]